MATKEKRRSSGLGQVRLQTEEVQGLGEKACLLPGMCDAASKLPTNQWCGGPCPRSTATPTRPQISTACFIQQTFQCRLRGPCVRSPSWPSRRVFWQPGLAGRQDRPPSAQGSPAQTELGDQGASLGLASPASGQGQLRSHGSCGWNPAWRPRGPSRAGRELLHEARSPREPSPVPVHLRPGARAPWVPGLPTMAGHSSHVQSRGQQLLSMWGAVSQHHATVWRGGAAFGGRLPSSRARHGEPQGKRGILPARDPRDLQDCCPHPL